MRLPHSYHRRLSKALGPLAHFKDCGRWHSGPLPPVLMARNYGWQRKTLPTLSRVSMESPAGLKSGRSSRATRASSVPSCALL
jgi:hypothetical protein